MGCVASNGISVIQTGVNRWDGFSEDVFNTILDNLWLVRLIPKLKICPHILKSFPAKLLISQSNTNLSVTGVSLRNSGKSSLACEGSVKSETGRRPGREGSKIHIILLFSYFKNNHRESFIWARFSTWLKGRCISSRLGFTFLPLKSYQTVCSRMKSNITSLFPGFLEGDKWWNS